jgi:hypothetical protein
VIEPLLGRTRAGNAAYSFFFLGKKKLGLMLSRPIRLLSQFNLAKGRFRRILSKACTQQGM